MASEPRKAFWRFDRDETNRVSTERIGRGQPRADADSPVAEGRNGIAGRGRDGAAAPTAPTAAEVQGAIDAGRGRDKIAFPDPAAAPLGSDEAASATPGPDRGEAGLAHEGASKPTVAEHPDPDRGRYLGLALTLVALAVLIVVVAAIWR